MAPTSYHDLETSTYDRVRANPLTRIHGKPTWRQAQKLKDECKERVLDCQVTYDWADGQYGLLAMIIGDARYLALTGLNYVAPVSPPLTHPNITAHTTRHNTVVLTTENEEA